ncbi:ribonuclease H-like domain-containing protein [Tanacetum coccineum]
MVRSIWLFKHKFHVDGTLSRYKAHLVAYGSSQQLGVDFDETFSPVVKPATIRMVLSLVVSCQWPIHQLDVKNAFLMRSLYGLKQAPRAWFKRFAGYATRAGFYHSRYDSSLFIYRQGSQVPYLLIYVDDIILIASYPALLQQIICSLNNEFDMIDLGALNYILCISANRTPIGLHLYASSTNSLVGYTDADWAGCPSTRSAEAEYQGVANVVAENVWLRNLLRELHSPLSTATLVYCDNVSAVYMSSNPVQHQRMKHINIDIYFV